MELLATVDWLLQRQGVAPNVRALREGLKSWGNGSARKLRIFDDRLLNLALGHMPGPSAASPSGGKAFCLP